MELQIERMDPSLELPFYAHEDDAALDLPSADDYIIGPGKSESIRTGLKMAIPPGFVGLIWDRSGLAAKHSLHCLAGVIDSGYRGEISIVMVNLSDAEFAVQKGMRIAQILIQPVQQCRIVEVDSLSTNTQRGRGGFGSSGLH